MRVPLHRCNRRGHVLAWLDIIDGKTVLAYSTPQTYRSRERVTVSYPLGDGFTIPDDFAGGDTVVDLACSCNRSWQVLVFELLAPLWNITAERHPRQFTDNAGRELFDGPFAALSANKVSAQ